MPTKCCSPLLVILALGGCARPPLGASAAADEGRAAVPVAAETTPSAPILLASTLEPGDQREREAVALDAAAEPDRPLARPELLSDCDQGRAIVVRKGARLLELRCGDELAASYPVSLGFAPAGHKHHEGDGRTPEGEYYITAKFISSYHRSLQLSYPNVVDADRGLEEGQISSPEHAAIVAANRRCALPPQNTALGSLLQIHGGGGGSEVGDWTLGCVALDNLAIEQAYAFHLAGCDQQGRPRTVVVIVP